MFETVKNFFSNIFSGTSDVGTGATAKSLRDRDRSLFDSNLNNNRVINEPVISGDKVYAADTFNRTDNDSLGGTSSGGVWSRRKTDNAEELSIKKNRVIAKKRGQTELLQDEDGEYVTFAPIFTIDDVVSIDATTPAPTWVSGEDFKFGEGGGFNGAGGGSTFTTPEVSQPSFNNATTAPAYSSPEPSYEPSYSPPDTSSHSHSDSYSSGYSSDSSSSYSSSDSSSSSDSGGGDSGGGGGE